MAIVHGSTDQKIVVRVLTANNGLPSEGLAHNETGAAFWYQRTNGSKVAISLSAGTGLTATHSDGAWNEIDDGHYQIDAPDGAFASGASSVLFGGTITDKIVIPTKIELIADPPTLANQTSILSTCATATGFSTHSAADVTSDINTDVTFAAARASAITNGITSNPSIIAILADTDELQTNQGDWATATGFSTHTATAVWQVTSNQIWSDDTFGSDFRAILADTNELQTNQGNWLTATGNQVTTSNPVIKESTIELDHGDKYDGTRRDKLTWTVTKDYTGGPTVELRIWRDNSDGTQTTMKTAAGTVDSSVQLSVSMTATFDAALALTGGCPLFEKLRFALVVIESDDEETVAKGDCYVYERP